MHTSAARGQGVIDKPSGAHSPKTDYAKGETRVPTRHRREERAHKQDAPIYTRTHLCEGGSSSYTIMPGAIGMHDRLQHSQRHLAALCGMSGGRLETIARHYTSWSKAIGARLLLHLRQCHKRGMAPSVLLCRTVVGRRSEGDDSSCSPLSRSTVKSCCSASRSGELPCDSAEQKESASSGIRTAAGLGLDDSALTLASSAPGASRDQTEEVIMRT